VRKPNKLPVALKHGAYSQTGLLPGEDAAAFKKLHDDLVAEFFPRGAAEENIVADLARLYWRKQNMATYQLAEQARIRHAAIYSKLSLLQAPSVPTFADFTMWKSMGPGHDPDPEEIRAAQQEADKQAREELAEVRELIEIGKVATVEHLLEELSVVERLDGLIDRCIKRLLMVRGVKSMTIEPPETKPRALKSG
jgi:hypothetical protein